MATLPFLHGIWSFEANVVDAGEFLGCQKLYVCEDCHILFDALSGRVYRRFVCSEKVTRLILVVGVFVVAILAVASRLL